MRQWCLEIPEIVNISVNTPYPGTESWRHGIPQAFKREITALFDIQHAVLPTKMPLAGVLRGTGQDPTSPEYQKHLGWSGAEVARRKIAAGHLMRGQTNFVKMLWKFNSVYNPALQLADHRQAVL